jgi:dCTP deaminase
MSMLESWVERCLADFELKQLIGQGNIVASLERAEKNKSIQPGSFDPITSDVAFILDTEERGVFRSRPDESIYRTLLQLPNRQRRKVDISNGFEIKRGYTYLVKLEERLRLPKGHYARCSPKSSLGRVFLDTRLLADFNTGFDQVLFSEKYDAERDLWLLLQPLAFNLMLHPGLTLNQIRLLTGPNAALAAKDLAEEFSRHPLMYLKGNDGKTEPAPPIITDDGLQLNLNLIGQDTAGIVGLRARNNPHPIDLKSKASLDAMDFFEPVKAKDRQVSIDPGAHYLIASQQVLDIPAHLNAELAAYAHIGIRGPLHFAGFVDNGFRGDLVFEIRPDERSRMLLEHGMPISWLRFYRTNLPENVYGEEIGSHYHGQVGPKVAKYFVPFDFSFAAKNYEKLDRDVLTQDASLLLRHRKADEGFEAMDIKDSAALFEDVRSGFFHSRFDAEDDLLAIQPIPYLIIFGPERTVFTYVRTEKIKHYGEAKLFGKHSIGIGGHIIRSDAPEYINTCLLREKEEEVRVEGRLSEPRFAGTLMARDKPVDRVHFGMIYVAYTDGRVVPAEQSIVSSDMRRIDEIWNPFGISQDFETWSRILIQNYIHLFCQALLSANDSGIEVKFR